MSDLTCHDRTGDSARQVEWMCLVLVVSFASATKVVEINEDMCAVPFAPPRLIGAPFRHRKLWRYTLHTTCTIIHNHTQRTQC